MGKIFCLMGKSSSGKDTIFRYIRDDKKLSLRPIVTYTTRPIRTNEVNGVEYYFIDKVILDKYKAKGKVIEERVYHTINGDWHYATIDDGQIDLRYNYILIATLEAYTGLKSYFGEDNVIPFYIDVDDGTRLKRALHREMKQNKPSYDEVCRRFLADNKDFSKENLHLAGIDKYYTNHKLNKCIKDIREDILKNIY